MTTKMTQLARLLLAVAVALALVGPSRAAEPDERLIAKAQRFLENEGEAKAVLRFAHFGATYKGVEALEYSKVEDGNGRELSGYFALTVRYYWAGLLSDDEHTDLLFFFNDKGRFYKIGSDDQTKTTGVLKPFELSNAIIDATKEALINLAGDDREMKAQIETAVRNKDAKMLLRLKLILEQP